MNKLNETLQKLVSKRIGDTDKVTMSVKPDYMQAIEDGKEIPKVMEDRFKDQEKNKDKFIKDTYKTENKPKGTKDMKKMKLSESLFEHTTLKRVSHRKDFSDSHNDWKEMSENEAQERARLASIQNPKRIYFVEYNDLMDSSSDKVWINGNAYNSVDVVGEEIKPYTQLPPVLKEEKSLFEVADTHTFDPEALEDEIRNRLEAAIDNLAIELDGKFGYNAEWCNDDGMNVVSNTQITSMQSFIRAIMKNLLFYKDNIKDINEQLYDYNYVVVKDDGTYAGVPCESFEEARELSAQHEGSKIYNVTISKEQINEDTNCSNICKKCNKEPCECDKLNEATATLERPSLYYKKKRQPLADIIQRELTSGEVVYRESQPGKFNATHAPSLNLDEYDIGANSDSNGEYIIAWVPTEQDTKSVENIADKYNKESSSGMDKYAQGNKFYTKIYIDEEDWDEPYFDPYVPLRPSKGRDIDED